MYHESASSAHQNQRNLHAKRRVRSQDGGAVQGLVCPKPVPLCPSPAKRPHQRGSSWSQRASPLESSPSVSTINERSPSSRVGETNEREEAGREIRNILRSQGSWTERRDRREVGVGKSAAAPGRVVVDAPMPAWMPRRSASAMAGTTAVDMLSPGEARSSSSSSASTTEATRRQASATATPLQRQRHSRNCGPTTEVLSPTAPCSVDCTLRDDDEADDEVEGKECGDGNVCQAMEQQQHHQQQQQQRRQHHRRRRRCADRRMSSSLGELGATQAGDDLRLNVLSHSPGPADAQREQGRTFPRFGALSPPVRASNPITSNSPFLASPPLMSPYVALNTRVVQGAELGLFSVSPPPLPYPYVRFPLNPAFGGASLGS